MRLYLVCLTLIIWAIPNLTEALNTNMNEVYKWKLVDYEYPDEQTKNEAIESKTFIPANNIPLGIERWNDKLFITTPRWKTGVPSTLNTVSLNVFRIRVDACDRLWVLDSGIDDIQGAYKQLSSPCIFIFDLYSDSLIHSYMLKSSYVKEDSFFANIIVDVESKNCENAYAYIPDLGQYGVVVYSLKDNDSWRVKHHYFHMDPLEGTYYVSGITFYWTDGVFSLALSPTHEDGFRTAYFHPFSSRHEFFVSTRILRNRTIATDEKMNFGEFKILGSRRINSQAGASFLDEVTGVMFYTQVNRNGIECWNSKNNLYSPDTQYLVAFDDKSFIFPNDLKVDREDYLWVLTDNLPTFLFEELDPEDFNFYV